MQLTVRNNQTLVDMAMQGTGKAEALFAVAVLNGKGVTDDLAVEDIIETPANEPAQRSIVQFFNQASHYPASGVTSTEVIGLEGVDFWGIEDDLIIQ